MNGIHTRFLRIFIPLLAAFSAAGCSLLKLSVSTGDPLPKEALELRTKTRGFYYELSGEVAHAADSIVASAPDMATRIAAVRWKIRTTRAAVAAAMQGIPDVALADLWILCRRMDEFFAAAPDSLLFGAQSDIARETAQRLDRRIVELARQTLPPERCELTSRFVERYVLEHHVSEGDETDNTTLAWLEFLRENDVAYDYAVGSISEVLSDVNDRVSGRTQQLSDAIGWSKDMLEMRLQQDSLQTRLGAQLDSLERDFRRMVLVAEHLPEISDAVLRQLDDVSKEMMETMDASVERAFADVDSQRMGLQHYVTQEREALIEQLRSSAEELVRQTLDGIPGLIGRVLLYTVLALAVVIGIPFAVGFWLGGVRERARRGKPE